MVVIEVVVEMVHHVVVVNVGHVDVVVSGVDPVVPDSVLVSDD